MSGETVPTPAVLLAISVEIACYCAQQQKAFLSCKVCFMYRSHHSYSVDSHRTCEDETP